jgi:lysophospholipase L1-like esterase
MFLGDSFTFGHSAEPVSNCFADLTALRGVRVYNTGISSTDPAQYARVAEVYAPKLRPDHVVLMFYVGNDLMLYPRTPEPNKAPYYSTSVGLLNACPMGEYLPDAGAAYRFLLATHFMPDQATNRFNRWCAKTVLTTKLWMVFARFGWVKRYGEEFQAYYERNLPRHRFEDQHYAEAYVLKAKAAAEAAGATFDCVIIPQRGQYDRQAVMKRLHFQQIQPVWFDGFDDRHYVSGNDNHFNNAGHARMAEHLATLLAARHRNR